MSCDFSEYILFLIFINRYHFLFSYFFVPLLLINDNFFFSWISFTIFELRKMSKNNFKHPIKLSTLNRASKHKYKYINVRSILRSEFKIVLFKYHFSNVIFTVTSFITRGTIIYNFLILPSSYVTLTLQI